MCGLILLASQSALTVLAEETTSDNNMNMFAKSNFIEKEQPALTEETKQLIACYKRTPNEKNYCNLRNEVIKNYEAVLARKEEKFAERRKETAGKPGGDEKVAELWKKSCRKCM